MLPSLILLLFIELHGPTGQVLHVNAAEISTLREPISADGHWARGTHCIIVMTNGKVIGVAEDCATVEHKLTQ
jgi:hypothetical protein